MSSNALPSSTSQDFARPSLSDTRRPATSAGIVNVTPDHMGAPDGINGQMGYGQFQQGSPGIVQMRVGSAGKVIQGNGLSYDINRRSSLGLTPMEQNNVLTASNNQQQHQQHQPQPPQKHNHPSSFPIDPNAPPGSAGNMMNANPAAILRRESDANYAGVFAHTVEDANTSPRTGHPGFAPNNDILDPSLLSSHPSSRPVSQHQANVRFESPIGQNNNVDQRYHPAAAYRRASEPHFVKNEYGPPGMYQPLEMGGPYSHNLNVRDLQVEGQPDNRGGEAQPNSAPAFGQMGNMHSPNSAQFASNNAPARGGSYGGNYNTYPPPSHMQQWQYNNNFPHGSSNQQRRRPTTQDGPGRYYGNPDAPQEPEGPGSRRPSTVVDDPHYVQEPRHSMEVPPGSQWSAFPIDYRLSGGDVNTRPATAGSQLDMASAAADMAIGAYHDPSAAAAAAAAAGLVYPHGDARNNSYSTGSTQSRQSLDARRHGGPRRSSANSLYGLGDDHDQQDPSSGASTRKRPRRRFDQIERLYPCRFEGCEKSYGTLNHLNAHVTMQKHGNKRKPEGELLFFIPSACI